MPTKVGLQFWQMELNDLPNDPMIDRCVAVDQNVPEAYRPLKVGHSRRQDGIDAPQGGQRLTRDFELTFHALLSMSSAM